MGDDQNGSQAMAELLADLTNESEADATTTTPAEPAKVGADAKTETETAKESDSADEAAETDDSDDADDTEDDDKAEKPKRRSGVQRLKAQNQRLQAEIEALRSSAPMRAGETLETAIQAEIGAPPQEKDFSDYLAYERAMTAYTVKQAIAEDRIRSRVEQFTTREQNRVRELVENYEEGQDKARKVISDYDAVIASAKDAKVLPHVEGLLLESDKSALLAYHLAKNPDKLARLNAMPPVQAAREIGRLEARLSLPSANKVTKAPPPVASVRGGATPRDEDSDLEAWLTKTYRR